jgi:hypothetical protein
MQWTGRLLQVWAGPTCDFGQVGWTGQILIFWYNACSFGCRTPAAERFLWIMEENWRQIQKAPWQVRGFCAPKGNSWREYEQEERSTN